MPRAMEAETWGGEQGGMTLLHRLVETMQSATPPLHLLGWGEGGAAALAAACRRPGRVATLTLVDPVIPELSRPGRGRMLAARSMPGAAYGLRLDVVRRLAIPTLLIESAAASPEARWVTRRLNAVSRRCRYRSVGSDPMTRSSARDEAWVLIAEHIVERGGTISRELFLAA